jgi:DNA-directed RNA polymerase specialized sigma24 family protein
VVPENRESRIDFIMPNPTSSAGNRGRNREDWAKLLLRLDPSAECAEEKYNGVRFRLVTFFKSHHCAVPEDLADEVLHRVAAKLDTEEIRDVMQFCIGVARYVLHETYKREQREIHIEALPAGPNGVPDGHDPEKEIVKKLYEERRLDCLRHCLASLMPDDRQLIIQFYSAEEKLQIPFRKQLASIFGITVPTLRGRACRIRAQLETCVNLCLESPAKARLGLINGSQPSEPAGASS